MYNIDEYNFFRHITLSSSADTNNLMKLIKVESVNFRW